MTDERVEVGRSYAFDAFERVARVRNDFAGSFQNGRDWMSDGRKGVQWNVSVEAESECVRLGVNLEGMKYDGWPIATFIENELRHSLLLETGSTLEESREIWVAFYRDAWQRQARPNIEEKLIAGKAIRLSDLDGNQWRRVLQEASACLDAEDNHRGRARQVVTLVRSGKQVMEVSPHLRIYTTVWDATPASEELARVRMERGFQLLEPIHEIVTRQSH